MAWGRRDKNQGDNDDKAPKEIKGTCDICGDEIWSTPDQMKDAKAIHKAIVHNK